MGANFHLTYMVFCYHTPLVLVKILDCLMLWISTCVSYLNQYMAIFEQPRAVVIRFQKYIDYFQHKDDLVGTEIPAVRFSLFVC